MELEKIGIIHSPYDRQRKNKAPGQGKKDVFSKIEILKEYQDGLNGLHIHDKILVIYWADMANRNELIVKRRGNGKLQGIFSLRSPHRPNPILISHCEIFEINQNILTVNGLEALDDSILLDIKISRH